VESGTNGGKEEKQKQMWVKIEDRWIEVVRKC